MRTTPDALERRAAQQEAAALREEAQAAKVRRAMALLAEGLSQREVARQLAISPAVLRRMRGEAA